MAPSVGSLNLWQVVPRPSATLTGAKICVPKCSAYATWILFGRAGANDLSQPRTDHVFKNCPVHVESLEKGFNNFFFELSFC